MSDISKNIKKYRTKAILTQQELADRLNVTRQAVSSWENGKNQPDVQTLEAIARELGITLEEILYGSKQQMNKKHAIRCAVVWGIIFLAGLVVCLYAEPYITYYVSTHYVIYPSVIYVCIVKPLLYIVLGVFVCSLLAIFFPIYIKKREQKRLFLVVGIIIVFCVTILALMYFLVSSIMLALISQAYSVILSGGMILFVLPGILFWLGIAKEPK